MIIMTFRIIFIVLDGLGDRPCKELYGETPLEAASTPFMDYLAREGICGFHVPIDPGIVVESGPAHFELFGYHPFREFYPGRGVLEALGIGAKLEKGDIALRVNFATIKDGKIMDRRAGRIEDVSVFEKDLTMEIDGVQFILKAGVEHRAALIIRGSGLSSEIEGNDPHKTGRKPLKIKPKTRNPDAVKTAKLLQKYIDKAAGILSTHDVNREREKKGLPPANYLLVRGAGEYRSAESFRERYDLKACCIAGAGLYKGVARYFGMDVLNVRGASGTKNTDVDAKILAAKNALKNYDFIFLHVKATDLFGHDGDAIGKKEFIERFDKALSKIYGVDGVIVVTGDHSTPCSLMDHSGDDVPLLIHGEGVRADNCFRFGERDCHCGLLSRIHAKDVIHEVLNLIGEERIVE